MTDLQPIPPANFNADAQVSRRKFVAASTLAIAAVHTSSSAIQAVQSELIIGEGPYKVA